MGLRSLLLALVALLAPALAMADHVIAKKADGTTVDYPGVTVKGFVRAANAATFWITFPNGETHPLLAERAILVEWGDAGAGRQTSITVGDRAKGDAAPYTATLKTFKDGKFKASPEGDPKDYYIALANMQAFAEPGFTPPGPDAATTPPTDSTDDVFNSSTPDSALPATPSNAAADDPAAGVLPAAAATPKFNNPMLDEFSRLGGGKPQPSGFKALSFLSGLFVIFMWIFMIIKAGKQGDTLWLIAIVVTCCCSPITNALYAFIGYKGEDKDTIKMLVGVELALWIGVAVWQKAAGYALM